MSLVSIITVVLLIPRTSSFNPLSPFSHRTTYLLSSNDITDDDEAFLPSLPSRYEIRVTYHSHTSSIFIKPGNETILTALERQASANLCLPSVPYECRRGNCLTCVARQKPSSEKSSLLRIDQDYLLPELRKDGYVLLCLSYVIGEGVDLELGVNNDVWDYVHSKRYKTEEMERIQCEAIAKSIRLSDESNVPRWKRRMEYLMKKKQQDEK